MGGTHAWKKSCPDRPCLILLSPRSRLLATAKEMLGEKPAGWGTWSLADSICPALQVRAMAAGWVTTAWGPGPDHLDLNQLLHIGRVFRYNTQLTYQEKNYDLKLFVFCTEL